VAAIEGGALGGGAELATACDHLVMASDAAVRFVQVSLGVCTGWGGGPRLVRLLGRRDALRLLGTACRVSAQQALQLGLADRLAPPGAAAQVAGELLEPYLAHPTPAVRAMKAVVAAADDVPLDAALAVEAKLFGGLWGGEANQAALAPRRKPPPG
jgi:ethylmalonyl-CoA/methylmalonyl-CoA decarboxylase